MRKIIEAMIQRWESDERDFRECADGVDLNKENQVVDEVARKAYFTNMADLCKQHVDECKSLINIIEIQESKLG